MFWHLDSDADCTFFKDVLLLNLFLQDWWWYVLSECILALCNWKIFFSISISFQLCSGCVFKLFTYPGRSSHSWTEAPFWLWTVEVLWFCLWALVLWWLLSGSEQKAKKRTVGATDIWIRLYMVGESFLWDSYCTCWKQACTKFSGKRFRMRSKKASTLDTSSFFFPCPRLALSLGFPGWMSSTRMTPRMAAITVVDM